MLNPEDGQWLKQLTPKNEICHAREGGHPASASNGIPACTGMTNRTVASSKPRRNNSKFLVLLLSQLCDFDFFILSRSEMVVDFGQQLLFVQNVFHRDLRN